MELLAGHVRDFNRYYTRRIGVLTDRYLGQERPLGEARLLFEVGDGACVSTLRTSLGIDSGYLSRLLRSLEHQGLVNVDRHPGDARSRVATLTAAGRFELDELNARSTRSASELLAPLAATQREQLVDAMDRVQRLLRLAAVTIEAVKPGSALARSTLAAYAAELRERFPEGYADGDLVRPAELRAPRGVMLVATEDGQAIGCGAVRTLEPGVGEVRHIWVKAQARRIGLGRRLMTEVEEHARALGMHTLRLGTHRVLGEAVAMYRGLGYAETEPYGDTAHNHHWFTKDL